MLRVKRFAAAIDMIAAGHQRADADRGEGHPGEPVGEHVLEQLRDRQLRVVALDRRRRPIAMKPSSASRPSISEYSGRIVVLRRITLRLRAGERRRDRVRVHEQRQRRAERQRRVRPLARSARCTSAPRGLPVAGFFCGVRLARLARRCRRSRPA